MKIKDIKQGNIVKTDFGIMVVVNADFDKGIIQGYQIRTKGNKPYIAQYHGEEVELIEDFN